MSSRLVSGSLNPPKVSLNTTSECRFPDCIPNCHISSAHQCPPVASIDFEKSQRTVRLDTLAPILQDFRTVVNLEEAVTIATMDSSPAAPAQPIVSYSLRDAGDADLQELPDENSEDATTAAFVSQFESVEEGEATDVPTTMVERGGPSLNEVKTQGLGPMEALDDEVFRVVTRPLTARAATATTTLHDNTATATKDVVVCKFCSAEFPYLVRDVDHHKSICEGYKQHQHGQGPQTSKATDATETSAMVDDEEEEDDDMDMPDMSLDVDVEEDEEEDETQLNEDGGSREEDQSRGTDSRAPQPRSEQEMNEEQAPQPGRDASDHQQTRVAQEEESKEGDDDETQILESDPRSAMAPDRIDDAGAAAAQVVMPVLKVVPRRSDTGDEPTSSVTAIAAVGGDASPDVERGAASDDDESMDNGSTPSETNGDGGDAATSSDNKMSYRIFEDGSGVRAHCLICGKDVANRGSAKASHRKKCRKAKQTPQHRATPSDDKQAPLLQTMTPKKKPAKRRINQELESLDQDLFDVDDEGPYRLRSGKKAKLDHPSGSVEAPAASPTASAATALTVVTPMTQGSTPQNRAPAAATAQLDEDPLDQFDLVDDVLHAKRMVCKHCKTELSFRRDYAKRHLNVCDAAIKATEPASQQRTKTSGKELTMLALLRHPEQLTVEHILALDADALRTWLYGSAPKADEALHHYGNAPLVMRGPTARPVARFQAIVDVLAGLDVKRMMAQSLSDTTFTAMVGRTCMMPLSSASKAWQVYQDGNPIAFCPPEVIAQMMVPSLAADLRCGTLVSTEMHDVKVICSCAPFTWDWQFHKSDVVVVCLRGKFLWKMKRSPVKAPTTCFHAPSPAGTDTVLGGLEAYVATHLAGAARGCTAADLAPPTSSAFAFSNDDEDDDEDMGDGDGGGEGGTTRAATPGNADDGQQVVVDAGSVVYMPPGTWYHAKALEGNAVLLQIQLRSGGLGQILAEALLRLIAQPEWVAREREILSSPAPRRGIQRLVRATTRQFSELQPTELAPPLLFGAEDDTVVPTEMVVHGDAKTRYMVKWYEIDLADRNGFTGGQELQLLAGSMFRVNPLTTLMAVDELLQFGATSMAPTSTALASAAIAMAATATPKKALNRKQKRVNHAGTNNGAISSQAKNVYVLVWGSGDATRMMVKFHCSAVQRVLVEWIRSCETGDAFHVAELKKLLASVQGGTADTDELKHVLRFLWTIGYVANVEVPL